MTDTYTTALDTFFERIEGLTNVKQQSLPPLVWARTLLEEAIEADEAIRNLNPYSGEPANRAHVAKELADVVYRAFGAARRFGIPLDAVFNVVHTDNMKKLSESTVAADGHITKPVDYKQPYDEIWKVLDERT